MTLDFIYIVSKSSKVKLNNNQTIRVFVKLVKRDKDKSIKYS